MPRGSLLVLDQSLSSTGFALMRPEDGGEIVSGSWPLCAGEAHRPEGFREFWRRLDEANKAHGLGQLVIEQPPLGTINQGAGQIFGKIGLVAIAELFCCSRNIALESYAPQSWRSTFFTKAERKAIRGGDWKRPAILRCRQLGFDPLTDDEAEAIAILDHHLHRHQLKAPWRERAGPLLDPVA